jgi:hypothetical protein
MGIEPTKPLLAQSFIGFEDRGRHQSGTRFHRGNYTENGSTANSAHEQSRSKDDAVAGARDLVTS